MMDAEATRGRKSRDTQGLLDELSEAHYRLLKLFKMFGNSEVNCTSNFLHIPKCRKISCTSQSAGKFPAHPKVQENFLHIPKCRKISCTSQSAGKFPAHPKVQENFLHIPKCRKISCTSQSAGKFPAHPKVQENFLHIPKCRKISCTSQSAGKFPAHPKVQENFLHIPKCRNIPNCSCTFVVGVPALFCWKPCHFYWVYITIHTFVGYMVPTSVLSVHNHPHFCRMYVLHYLALSCIALQLL